MNDNEETTSKLVTICLSHDCKCTNPKQNICKWYNILKEKYKPVTFANQVVIIHHNNRMKKNNILLN